MVEFLEGTKYPLTEIGKNAGICWKSDISDGMKNYKRALSCIESGHGRVMEYPDVTLLITGYSARCIRELYTHIIGTTRLQSSTRYIDMSNFKFYDPSLTEEQSKIYNDTMEIIKSNYEKLIAQGMSKEDAANILPLGMHTEIVLKINLRALEHFMNMRLCSRAYKEIRKLCVEMKKCISGISEEWKVLCDTIFVPNCVKYGYCPEDKCCGKAITKKEMEKILSEYKNNIKDGKQGEN